MSASHFSHYNYPFFIKIKNSLFSSPRNGQVRCVRILLERGAVVAADKAGVTPLQLCAQVRMLSLVVSKG